MAGEKGRAIIVGGGPGGLTAALALRQVGFDPIVFERAQADEQRGTGLTLWPNAFCALDKLGLAEAVQEVCFPMSGIAMRSWRGDFFFKLMGNRKNDFLDGHTGMTVHRPDLMAVLLTALGRSKVAFGARCTGFQQSSEGVTAYFGDGNEVSGELLIGADGINSVIRSQLLGQLKLLYAGYVVWRGVAVYNLEEPIGTTSMGRGRQFGYFPMTDNRVYWFASASLPAGGTDEATGRKQQLIERFGAWHSPVPGIIKATSAEAIIRNDIYDLDPLATWGEGRVRLLGDAAHPAVPTLGQGACQAIEDAVVLAACLRQSPQVNRALADYEARRKQRTKVITLQSRRLGRMGYWKNPLACWIRNQVMKRIPPSIRLWQLSRMFRFEA